MRGCLRFQFFLQAVLQFGADLGDFHSGAHEKLAAQEIMRALFVGKLSGDAAILAILIPAEAAVRDRIRADVLKTTKDRVLFRHLEGFPKDFDFDEAFVRAKYLARFPRGDLF
jgi:hypothetical protein